MRALGAHMLFPLLLAASLQAEGTPLLAPHEGAHLVGVQANASRVPLCDVLASIQPGEERPMVVQGIYANQLLYDPKEPICRWDVQPSTLVEMRAPERERRDLDRLLAKDRRAAVVFRGRLVGPGAVKPDDLSIPAPVASINRVGGRRYGHLNAFRTKFIVEGIIEARSVPADVPWDQTWHRPQGREIVYSGELPVYPWRALWAGIAGDVRLRVMVKEGDVSSVEREEGDRLLAEDAIRTVQSWKFDRFVSTTFETIFSFVLEPRDTGSSGAHRTELELPYRVKIIAPRYDW